MASCLEYIKINYDSIENFKNMIIPKLRMRRRNKNSKICKKILTIFKENKCYKNYKELTFIKKYVTEVIVENKALKINLSVFEEYNTNCEEYIVKYIENTSKRKCKKCYLLEFLHLVEIFSFIEKINKTKNTPSKQEYLMIKINNLINEVISNV